MTARAGRRRRAARPSKRCSPASSSGSRLVASTVRPVRTAASRPSNGRGGEDVLEVVDDEQKLLGGEEPRERFLAPTRPQRRSAPSRADQCRWHLLALDTPASSTQRRRPERGPSALCDRQRQPRLADAPGPRELSSRTSARPSNDVTVAIARSRPIVGVGGSGGPVAAVLLEQGPSPRRPCRPGRRHRHRAPVPARARAQGSALERLSSGPAAGPSSSASCARMRR